MAPKLPALSAPISKDGSSSPELGSPSKMTQYNKKTGRPIRRSAGKVKKVAGYVDSATLEQQLEEFEAAEFSPLTSGESEDEDEMNHRGRADKSRRKRKRSPSPPSPRLDPIIYDQELDELTDSESNGVFRHQTPKKPPVTLQFNVPLGFHGPLFVKLDSSMLQVNEEGARQDMRKGRAKKARMTTPIPDRTTTQRRRTGFTDLPPELRNTVYRHVFVRKNQDFKVYRRDRESAGTPPSMCQSAQFLRTCKTVHNEGCSILYGENTFVFDRSQGTRGPFYISEPKEIGYQDALQFLKMMGAENLQYLRDLKICFDDAAPKDTTYVSSNEDRRFLNDDVLINCLRLLRKAKLRTLALCFIGRRTLWASDTKFLGYLEQVKVDALIKWSPGRYFVQERIGEHIWRTLKEQMVRPESLYDTK
ncbi:hypothetical protein P153DRAFT_380307 [Dothidotthia symphoricarpi CBS 119687]|uniref:Uncharacterized protein n=1 Tax=Dothidotthia symphoricarpi CBS 119687 TaxID=1392245 RepID=A0A6A6ARD3_9PLEO|nr:uncharacterized protein P153DRAFT_380307 [Dothidotthia symphoricarpi CBS 119687]KAF2134489.1 hypothetical protein P153DRAFT_380307 [Dothidotthia symphoricarpi CBS 119687]